MKQDCTQQALVVYTVSGVNHTSFEYIWLHHLWDTHHKLASVPGLTLLLSINFFIVDLVSARHTIVLEYEPLNLHIEKG